MAGYFSFLSDFLSPEEVLVEKVRKGELHPEDIDLEEVGSSELMPHAGRFILAISGLLKLKVEVRLGRPQGRKDAVQRAGIPVEESVPLHKEFRVDLWQDGEDKA